MVNYSFGTKTNKVASQSKNSSIPASTTEMERKTTKTKWEKTDGRLKKTDDFTGAQRTPEIKSKLHLTQKTHKVSCSLCSLRQTNLSKFLQTSRYAPGSTDLTRDTIHPKDAAHELFMDLCGSAAPRMCKETSSADPHDN